ncbi:MAG UNVERIFIED_CONTAM: DUF1553 domain-containing protein [Planctomycetaceae bacterium]|jgi:hypothetical protein
MGDQHAFELRAIAAAFPQQPPAALNLPLARWMSPFDADTAKVFQAEQAHLAAAPRPDFREVYTTVPGGQDVHLLRRGEVDNKLGLAQPGFLQVLWRGPQPAAPLAEPAEPPRVALARWITDLEHGAGPLAARVIVNRVWQHHFGEGLVGTPNDFGVQGDPPSHPELLEYLAAELVRGGWKLKPLHRAILLSDTWQLAHTAVPENLAKDPANRWLWHFKPRRLEAESIRDSLLAVGGSLDHTLYGPSVLDNTPRRSVYLRVKRSELLPIMTVFDAPEPTQSIGERSITTVPTQALTLLNSPIVRQQAEKLAATVRATPEDRLRTPFAMPGSEHSQGPRTRGAQPHAVLHPSTVHRTRGSIPGNRSTRIRRVLSCAALPERIRLHRLRQSCSAITHPAKSSFRHVVDFSSNPGFGFSSLALASLLHAESSGQEPAVAPAAPTGTATIPPTDPLRCVRHIFQVA